MALRTLLILCCLIAIIRVRLPFTDACFNKLYRSFISKVINKTNSISEIVAKPKPMMIQHPQSNIAFQGINGCHAINTLASGSFGQVYLVRMPYLKTECHKQEAALKVFSAGDVNFECEREQAVLEYIAMHERQRKKALQIAHIRDDIQGVSCPNLMLEYIYGFDLNHSILKNYEFAVLVRFAEHMMHEIGFGVLNSLHSMNIYHNDLKPANIMFHTGKQLFYLIDFGVAVPLTLLNRPEFRYAMFFTTLSFMSPWHLRLVRRQSRYFIDAEHKMSVLNSNETRELAANADFWSFGLTVLRVLGMHCNGNYSLCLMSKQIVALQDSYFDAAEERAFVHWDLGDIERMLLPFWARIQEIIMNYVVHINGSKTLLISSLMKWFHLVQRL